MDVLVYWPYALAYVVAMLLHELGHWMAAAWYGVRVNRVFLFFDANDVALCRWKLGFTTFGIGWLPLGSYAEIAGVERMRSGVASWLFAPLPWELQARSPFAQAVIVLAGVLVNLMTAVLVHFAGPEWAQPLAVVSFVNVLLQLLPAGPTDGWMLFEVLMPRSMWKGTYRFLLGMAVVYAAMLSYLSF